MELIIIRHALPMRIVNAVGAADPELQDIGHQQAEKVAEYLRSEHLDAIFASPMRRAQQTADPIAAAFGLPIITDDRISEWDRMSNSYIPVEELKATNDPHWQAMQRGEWLGEGDLSVFRKGIQDAFEEIIRTHSGKQVAVVCHGGVINAYLAMVLDIVGEPTGFFYPDYTSIHRVRAASTGERSIRSINEIAHLRHTGLL
jgi:2,3-bisphosphoglycerate-dependent phosphoglycerate mutase